MQLLIIQIEKLLILGLLNISGFNLARMMMEMISLKLLYLKNILRNGKWEMNLIIRLMMKKIVYYTQNIEI